MRRGGGSETIYQGSISICSGRGTRNAGREGGREGGRERNAGGAEEEGPLEAFR